MGSGLEIGLRIIHTMRDANRVGPSFPPLKNSIYRPHTVLYYSQIVAILAPGWVIVSNTGTMLAVVIYTLSTHVPMVYLRNVLGFDLL